MTLEQLNTITKLLDIGEIEDISPITCYRSTGPYAQLVQILINDDQFFIDVMVDGSTWARNNVGVEHGWIFVDKMLKAAAHKKSLPGAA